MRVFDVRNVAEAYSAGLTYLSAQGVREGSRNGEVLVASEPVTTVYRRPTERVLIDAQRDANPFFHVMESVWMLAGQRDGRWLDHYVRDFSSRYAEDDGMMHGAYGYRWRDHFDVDGGGVPGLPDQLTMIGDMMYADPTTRRAVLTMWDPVADLGASKRDLPCNTHAYVRGIQDHLDGGWIMDLTVLCRSNDIVWGAYGANAVHMSIMGEVLAGLGGMKFGTYRQVSNNYHVYSSILPRLGRWDRPSRTIYPGLRPWPIIQEGSREEMRDEARAVLLDAIALVDMVDFDSYVRDDLRSRWMREVAYPMAGAYRLWRRKLPGVSSAIDQIQSPDWRAACHEWVERRASRSGESANADS